MGAFERLYLRETEAKLQDETDYRLKAEAMAEAYFQAMLDLYTLLGELPVTVPDNKYHLVMNAGSLIHNHERFHPLASGAAYDRENAKDHVK